MGDGQHVSLELAKEGTHTAWHTCHRLGHQVPSVPAQQLHEALGAENSTGAMLGLHWERASYSYL